MVLRGETGNFVTGKAKIISGMLSPCLAEACCLKEALSWIKAAQWMNVVAKMDAKVVVDDLHSDSPNLTEYGQVIQQCKRSLFDCQNVTLVFACRRVNNVAHSIERAADSLPNLLL